jgi:hypothetical protein
MQDFQVRVSESQSEEFSNVHKVLDKLSGHADLQEGLLRRLSNVAASRPSADAAAASLRSYLQSLDQSRAGG